MLAKQLLLLLGGEIDIALRIRARALAAGVGVEGPDEFAGASLEHTRDTVALVGSRDGRDLRHEVEVKELDKLEFDLTGCRSRFEERSDSEKAIKALKCACVDWSVDEGGDECEKSRRLDRGAVVWLKKVEKKLDMVLVYVDLTVERLSHTFIFCSRAKRDLLGGCSNSSPWIRSRALRIKRSFPPSPPLAISRSRVPIRRMGTFHSNPSCSLKNSRKAGS